MTNPAPYIVSYSFSGFQANNPTTPLPAQQVDNELANIATSIAQLGAFTEGVIRSDGALNNGVVTFDSLELGLQFTIDPTNGELVAAAVAGAQANQVASAASATAAAGSAASALTQATAAAASAASVNFALFLPKAGNLAGLGSNDTALANISAAKNDGTNMTGRLAPLTGQAVTDWNTVATSGWSCGTAAANGPDSVNTWLVQSIAVDAFTITQIAYNVSQASGGSSAGVAIYRRHSYSLGGTRTWDPWAAASPVPVGSTIWHNGATAPPGFIKENGALILRATFPELWAFALVSGNVTSDATWVGGNFGAFSAGDGSTTFRVPDMRGEFARGFDDGKGIDAGRVIGSHQDHAFKDHTHSYVGSGSIRNDGTSAADAMTNPTTIQTGAASVGAGTETRPRNNTKLCCIKY